MSLVKLSCFVCQLRNYHKITLIVCSQKLISALADIAVHICQIKRSAGKKFPAVASISLLVALEIKGLII